MADVLQDSADHSDAELDRSGVEGAHDESTHFENPQLAREALPDYRELDFESVAGNFRGYTVLTTLIYWVPALLIASAINLLPGVTLLPGLLTPAAIALIALLVGIYRWADAGQRGWAVREHDLSAREGIYWRSVTTLPYARIQHVETTSGPIERWRGLARLKLFTAGGMTADLTLIGLEADAADTLREHLAEQIRLRDARAGDAVESSGAPEESASPDEAKGSMKESSEDSGPPSDTERAP
jgi:membrane protein YdbS with pleckstrin-like domain